MTHEEIDDIDAPQQMWGQGISFKKVRHMLLTWMTGHTGWLMHTGIL